MNTFTKRLVKASTGSSNSVRTGSKLGFNSKLSAGLIAGGGLARLAKSEKAGHYFNEAKSFTTDQVVGLGKDQIKPEY